MASPKGGSTEVALARKLRAPSLPSWVIGRPRIDDLLQGQFSSSDLVEMVAAPGSGKTVAAQLFATRFSWPTVWLSLDSTDRPPARLVANFARALGPYERTASALVSEALHSGMAPVEAAAILAEHVETDGLLIVVDNCEEVSSYPETLAVLEALLAYLPASARVLLLSRESLNSLTRIGLNGGISRIGDLDLAFTLDEIRLLLMAAGRADSSSPDDVLGETGGWAAGIAFEADLPRPSARADLAAYLNYEILSRLTAEEQTFLLCTSLLDEVTAHSAEVLCGRDGPLLLERVSRHLLPATCGPDGGLIYHPCFKQFLVDRLEKERPEVSDQLRRRQAKVSQTSGDRQRAVEILLSLGDLDEALRVAEQAASDVIERADWTSLLGWLEALGPERVERSPRLLGAKVRALTQVHRIPEAQSLIRDLHRRKRLGQVADIDPGVVAHTGWAFMSHPLEGLEILQHYSCDHQAEALRFTLRVMSGRDPVTPPAGAGFGDVQRMLNLGLYLQGRVGALSASGPTEAEWPPSGFARAPATNPLRCLLWAGNASDARLLADQVPIEIRSGTSASMWRNLEAWLCISEGNFLGALQAGEEAVAISQRSRFGWEPYLSLAVGYALIRLCRYEDARAVLADVIDRSQAAGQLAFAEWAQTYQGAAQLLVGANGAGLRTLRRCVETMQVAGRRLMLPAALVYLSEAEARAGSTERSMQLAQAASEISRSYRCVFPFEQALVDFPQIRDRLASAPSSTASDAMLAGLQPSTVPDSAHLLEVNPFGPRPDIWVDGSTCGIRRLKVIELAAYLALHGGTASRRQIQLDLFPDNDQRTGSNYFRQITHQFRRATGIALVRWEDDVVGLPVGVGLTSLDVQIESANLADGSSGVEKLVALLERSDGKYLEASSLAWVDDRRYQVEVLKAKLIEDAATLCLQQGQVELGGRLTERLQQVDSS